MIQTSNSVYEKPRHYKNSTYWYWFSSWRLPGRKNPVEKYLGPSRQGRAITREEAMVRAEALKRRDLKRIESLPSPISKPLIRYPGGKSRMRDHITKHLDRFGSDRYVEPFAGGLGVGLHVIGGMKESWINDADFNIYAMWHSVIHNHKELIELVSGFSPSVDAFREFKLRLANHKAEDLVQTGFMKMALHQISFSGLGERAGGPQGGVLQKENKIGSRWSFPRIKKQITLSHAILKNTQCTCMDFEAVLKQASGYAIYCDPPYYKRGNDLYAQRFSKEDHLRLAKVLQHKKMWILSYDNVAKIRSLYAPFASIEEVAVKYSINNPIQKKELIIYKD